MNINAINTMPKYMNNKNVRNNQTQTSQPLTTGDTVSFKGKKPGKVTEFFAEHYGKRVLNSKGVRNFCKKMAKWDPKNASSHFQVLGSLVTSSAYMKATLDNPNFDKKNANTLAINQGLGFVIPTIAAYTTDAMMRDFNKTLEYAYSAKQEKNFALGTFADEAAKEAAKKKLSNRLKGFRAFIGIVTFTTIYRYISPVAITPIANMIGNKINENNDKHDAESKAKTELKIDPKKSAEMPKVEAEEKEYRIGEKEVGSSAA